MDCPTCKGEGTVATSFGVDDVCPVCEGEGWVDMDDYLYANQTPEPEDEEESES